MKEKNKKTLSNWLTNRYLLIFRDEETFAEKTTIRFTYAKMIFFSVLIFLVLFIASLFLVRSLLSQWFDPRHEILESNKKIVNLSWAVDSLATEVDKKDQFILNIQSIIKGESVDIQQMNNIKTEDSTKTFYESEPDSAALDSIDAEFRKAFESVDISFPSVQEHTAELQELFFFPPISGIISSQYDPKIEHFGVDIVSKQNEPVKCVANGTVIFSSWVQETGYTLIVQHRSNLISVYKHNSALLKNRGDFVSAGEVISIIGNTGELSSGPHLHFELWYNGNPANPEEFVSF